MTERLTPEGYESTKRKLRNLEERLAAIEKRTDISAERLASVRRSYHMIMREFLQEMRLFEAQHGVAPHSP